jgi:hypothetical protein
MACKQGKRQQQLPTCLLSRPHKPTERKRAQSISTTSQPAKKPRNKPASLLLEPIFVEEEESIEVAVEEEDNKEVEEEDNEEVEEEDNEENEVEEDKDTSLLVYFTSVWKAVAASRKEVLPGTKSALFNVNNLFLYQLEAWRDQILLDLLLRKFAISQFQAIASYEKARQADYCPQEIRSRNDLYQALDLIKE